MKKDEAERLVDFGVLEQGFKEFDERLLNKACCCCKYWTLETSNRQNKLSGVEVINSYGACIRDPQWLVAHARHFCASFKKLSDFRRCPDDWLNRGSRNDLETERKKRLDVQRELKAAKAELRELKSKSRALDKPSENM